MRAHSKDEELVLWVDALCIDQVHMPERIHQVSIMGRIYGKCDEVYVWLGEVLGDEQSPLQVSYDGCVAFSETQVLKSANPDIMEMLESKVGELN